MTQLGSIGTWAFEHPRHQRGARALQVLMGCLLLLRVVTELRLGSLFWTPDGWPVPDVAVLGSSGKVLSEIFDSSLAVYGALIGLAACACLLIVGVRTQLASGVAMILYCLLRNRLPELTDAGDDIVRLFLFYMMFFIPPRTQPAPWSDEVWMHNLGVMLSIGQVCMVYFFAAVAKSMGEPWLHGTAVYLLSQNEFYISPVMRPILQSAVVTTLATYGVLLLQAWFPLALLSKLRPFWIAALMLFHAWTIIGMGLLSFGLAAVAMNLILITDAEYERLGAMLSRWQIRVSGAPGEIKRAAPLLDGPHVVERGEER